MSMVFASDKDVLERMVETHPNPKDGDIIVSPYVICKTCAYYVGQWCAEYMDFGSGGQWVYQPYDRATDYMETMTEAIEALERTRKYSGNGSKVMGTGPINADVVQSGTIWNEDRLEFESPCRMED